MLGVAADGRESRPRRGGKVRGGGGDWGGPGLETRVGTAAVSPPGHCRQGGEGESQAERRRNEQLRGETGGREWSEGEEGCTGRQGGMQMSD